MVLLKYCLALTKYFLVPSKRVCYYQNLTWCHQNRVGYNQNYQNLAKYYQTQNLGRYYKNILYTILYYKNINFILQYQKHITILSESSNLFEKSYMVLSKSHKLLTKYLQQQPKRNGYYQKSNMML